MQFGNHNRHFTGSITVFLCLLLTLVLGLVGACLEYGRAQAISAQVQLATDAAVESIFAGFHAPLFSEYQLLGRLIPGGSMDVLDKESLRYVHGCSGARKDLAEHGSFLRFQDEKTHWSDLAFLTDQNGKVFTHMAADALIQSGVKILKEEWDEHLGWNLPELDSNYRENHGKSGLEDTDFSKGVGDWSDTLRQAQEAAIEKAKAEDEEAARRAEEEKKAAEEAGQEYTPPPQGQAMKELQARRAEGKRFLEMIQDFKAMIDRGVLGIVVPKDRRISAGTIPSGGLPSELSVGEKSRCAPGTEVSGGNALLFREYLMRYMKTFTSDADLSVAYELEYVIAGKKTDQENLKAVAEKILLIRTALNLAYLAKSPEKQEEAMAAATLAVGWTGVVPLVEVTSKIFLAAWAMAEAACDVRALLAGKRVELLKTDSSWRLGFANLAKGALSEEAGEDADKAKNGMAYEDYLRILLYLSNGTTIAYRGMDVIQWNMARLDGEFRLSNCMVAGKMTVNVRTTPAFSALYGTGGLWKTLVYQKTGAFSYLKA